MPRAFFWSMVRSERRPIKVFWFLESISGVYTNCRHQFFRTESKNFKNQKIVVAYLKS